MHKIVLSYRRSDAEVIAGRIHDKLVAHYGREAVFMDIDTIPFGMDFRKHIRDALAETDLLLAIISPQWAGEGERRRIDEQNDYVRLEIETALQRNIPVIPVLVGRATMPSPNDLPESLADLAFRNAIAIDSGRDFHPHADRLIRSMDGHLAEIRRRTEQARIAQEEEARQRAEQQRLTREAEEARQRAEQARIAQEEEARQRAEQQRLTREAEEARQRAEQARIAQEEEARQRAEQARIAQEETAQPRSKKKLMSDYETIDKEIELVPAEIVQASEVVIAAPPHVLIAVHGMRDNAAWAGQIINDVGYFNETLIIAPINYGRLSTVDFFLGRREHEIDEILFSNIKKIAALNPHSPISIMCHSNGTKCVARLMKVIDIPIQYIFLCGSVCHIRDADALCRAERQPINDCGLRDPWPIFAEMIRPKKFNATGVLGFYQYPIIDRQFGFRHSGALTRSHFNDWIRPTIMEGRVLDTGRRQLGFLFHVPTYGRNLLIVAFLATIAFLALWYVGDYFRASF